MRTGDAAMMTQFVQPAHPAPLKLSGSYKIGAIDAKMIDQAYPLISVINPPPFLREWRQLCRSVVNPNLSDRGDREEIVVAINETGYVKGLCIYSIRDHSVYGRLLDVPIFIVASAADGEGVAEKLLGLICARCDQAVCSGVRFWTLDAGAWRRRSDPEYVSRSDHGLFMPAVAGVDEMVRALCARGIACADAIVLLSR
jgi:hypothetical protein